MCHRPLVGLSVKLSIDDLPYLSKMSCPHREVRLTVVVIFFLHVKVFDGCCAWVDRLSRAEEEILRLIGVVLELIFLGQILCPCVGL